MARIHAFTSSPLSIFAAVSPTSAAVSAASTSSADASLVIGTSSILGGSSLAEAGPVSGALLASALPVALEVCAAEVFSVLVTAGGASAIVVSDAGAGGTDFVPDPLLCTYAITASTVFCGPACSQTCTLPALSMTTTPRVVLLAAFFMPIAPVKVAETSHMRGNGSDCFVAKVVFDFGESVLRP
jgi:hypothetical protein